MSEPSAGFAYYLGVPVVVVEDHGDGWVTALWPDKENPGRSHKRPKPFTYRKGEWWKLLRSQVQVVAALPPFEPMSLAPKPEPNAEQTP